MHDHPGIKSSSSGQQLLMLIESTLKVKVAVWVNTLIQLLLYLALLFTPALISASFSNLSATQTQVSTEPYILNADESVGSVAQNTGYPLMN